jgi:putative transposase
VLRRFIGASETGASAASCFAAIRATSARSTFGTPEVGQYSAIPYRNTTYPPLSVWELRELRRTLSASGAAPIDEAAIFAAYARLREHEARAVTETKRARRVRVRRRAGSAVAVPADEQAPEVDAPALSSFAEIVPFAIEELR